MTIFSSDLICRCCPAYLFPVAPICCILRHSGSSASTLRPILACCLSHQPPQSIPSGISDCCSQSFLISHQRTPRNLLVNLQLATASQLKNELTVISVSCRSSFLTEVAERQDPCAGSQASRARYYEQLRSKQRWTEVSAVNTAIRLIL